MLCVKVWQGAGQPGDFLMCYHLGKTEAHVSPCIIGKRPIGPNLWMSTGISSVRIITLFQGCRPKLKGVNMGLQPQLRDCPSDS